MGEQKLCVITGCSNPGTKHMKLDIGPTIGDFTVATSARKHKVLVCDKHHRLLYPPETTGLISIGEDTVVKRNVFEENG